MIVLIRSNDVNPDPRVQKYIDFLESQNEPYVVLGWNRGTQEIKKKNHIYFHHKAKYGAKYLNILNKLRWFKFIYTFLKKESHNYTIVHACDIDTAIPAYLAKLSTKKPLIFDIFDWMSDEHYKGIVYSMIGFWEKKVFKESEHVIICEEERKKQIPVQKENVLVMPNIPKFNLTTDTVIADQIQEQKKSYDLILSYVGVFDYHRGLEHLLETVSNNKKLVLNIAGFGGLQEKVEQYAAANENIKYWGKVNYNSGLTLMKHSDLIMAMYYNTNPVHKFAAPNKYYEGLMLGTPIVTTENTLVGDKTRKYDTGFCIGEEKQDLHELLSSTSLLLQVKEKELNAKQTWEIYYQHYIQNFMNDTYLGIVKKSQTTN